MTAKGKYLDEKKRLKWLLNTNFKPGEWTIKINYLESKKP